MTTNWSPQTIFEMALHRSPPSGGAWQRELQAQHSTSPVRARHEQFSRLYSAYAALQRRYCHYADLRSAAQAQFDAELDQNYAAFERALDQAAFNTNTESDPIVMVSRRLLDLQAHFNGSPLVEIPVEQQESGRGEAGNKGKLDVARTLGYGGSRPDSAAVANDVGLSVDEVDGVSPGLHVSGTTLAYWHNYPDGTKDSIVKRLTGEGREHWDNRARTLIRAEIAAAGRREMIERGGKTGLDPLAHQRLAEVTRAR